MSEPPRNDVLVLDSLESADNQPPSEAFPSDPSLPLHGETDVDQAREIDDPTAMAADANPSDGLQIISVRLQPAVDEQIQHDGAYEQNSVETQLPASNSPVKPESSSLAPPLNSAEEVRLRLVFFVMLPDCQSES
jgi:hypothetical protein